MSSSSVPDSEEMDLKTALTLSQFHRSPVTILAEVEQSMHAERTEGLTNDALSQITIDCPSSRSSQPDCKLPDELLLRVLDLFVPRTGICISNDPDCDYYLRTIRSLLQTCYKIKQEILARTFENPLHIYITSGKRCRCQTLSEAKHIFKTPLGKALRMPFGRWSEVVISFVPAIHQSPRQACALEVQNMLRALPKAVDPTLHEMRCAMDCVSRQSNAVGKIMEVRAHVRNNRHNIRFRFRFDGSRGVDESNASRAEPLWTKNMMRHPLEAWRWTTAPVPRHHSLLPLPLMSLPSSITVALDMRTPNPLYPNFPAPPPAVHAEFLAQIASTFYRDFESFWHCGRRIPYQDILGEPGELGDRWVRRRVRGKRWAVSQRIYDVPYVCFVIQLSETLPNWDD